MANAENSLNILCGYARPIRHEIYANMRMQNYCDCDITETEDMSPQIRCIPLLLRNQNKMCSRLRRVFNVFQLTCITEF